MWEGRAQKKPNAETLTQFHTSTTQELLEDVLVLKPHIFPSVPRMWNRVYDRVSGPLRAEGKRRGGGAYGPGCTTR